MSGGSSSRLDEDQRRRARHFVWTVVALLAGFVLAAVVYAYWRLTWLAVALVVVSAVLRWVAMLLADAYPRALPRQRRRRKHQSR